jgi:alpha-tubulin suppressor-like RCC1 family protein
LIQGSNDYGQLAIGNELGEKVPFFPEFRKIDFFNGTEVIDVALAA